MLLFLPPEHTAGAVTSYVDPNLAAHSDCEDSIKGTRKVTCTTLTVYFEVQTEFYVTVSHAEQMLKERVRPA